MTFDEITKITGNRPAQGIDIVFEDGEVMGGDRLEQSEFDPLGVFNLWTLKSTDSMDCMIDGNEIVSIKFIH